MQELTREKAIYFHREMWNMIADVIEAKQYVQDIDLLKAELVRKRIPYRRVACNCFCCEFAWRFGSDGDDDCLLCPLDWGTDYENDYPCERDGGLWVQCRDCTDWKEQAALARKIANLPERAS